MHCPQNGMEVNVRKNPLTEALKMHDYLKAKDLMAETSDKVCGICVMDKSTYRQKLDVLNSDRFQKIN